MYLQPRWIGVSSCTGRQKWFSSLTQLCWPWFLQSALILISKAERGDKETMHKAGLCIHDSSDCVMVIKYFNLQGPRFFFPYLSFAFWKAFITSNCWSVNTLCLDSLYKVHQSLFLPVCLPVCQLSLSHAAALSVCSSCLLLWCHVGSQAELPPYIRAQL